MTGYNLPLSETGRRWKLADALAESARSGKAPPPPEPEFVIGLDLGQQADFSALGITERPNRPAAGRHPTPSGIYTAGRSGRPTSRSPTTSPNWPTAPS
jgi:hypothetical protein